MKYPKYIEEAIDIKSPYAKKYLKIVSRADIGDKTEDHHIVPVAYFEDVLGLKGCRKAYSPDMDSSNIVSLSPGRHLLAHYYLYKCARKCIRPQMASAVSMMFSLKDLDKRISELTERQAKEIANAKEEAKDFSGWKTRLLRFGLVSKILYKDGKKVYGFILKPDGTVRQYDDRRYGFTVDEAENLSTVDVEGPWVSMYENGLVIASTKNYKWDTKKVRYVRTGASAYIAGVTRDNVKIIKQYPVLCKYVTAEFVKKTLGFKEIIEKYFPKHLKSFDASWDKMDADLREMYPKVGSFKLPDVPPLNN